MVSVGHGYIQHQFHRANNTTSCVLSWTAVEITYKYCWGIPDNFIFIVLMCTELNPQSFSTAGIQNTSSVCISPLTAPYLICSTKSEWLEHCGSEKSLKDITCDFIANLSTKREVLLFVYNNVCLCVRVSVYVRVWTSGVYLVCIKWKLTCCVLICLSVHHYPLLWKFVK